MVVVKDGEIPFTRILDRVANGSRDFTQVPGLDLPDAVDRVNGQNARGPSPDRSSGGASPRSTTVRIWTRPNTTSRWRQRHGPGTFNVTWETNRGCPYSCSFCDWGSSTMSRIRAFDIERVRAEAEWIGRMRPAFVFVADANFGILPRDMEIADSLDRIYRTTGYPKSLYYSPAKNHPDRTVEIALKFAGSGIAAFHTLAIQHTNPERARLRRSCKHLHRETAPDRPPPARARCSARRAADRRIAGRFAGSMEGVPCRADGVGCPSGVHRVSLQPAAECAGRRTGDAGEMAAALDRSRRRPPSERQAKGRGSDSVLTSRIVVATHTYSPEDWVEMRVYTAFVQALHNCSLTRLIALYLHFTHGVSYDRFYRLVIDDLCSRPDHWLGGVEARAGAALPPGDRRSRDDRRSAAR